ncbi:hypothetical protein IM816_16730 [Luteibacter flocculans]|uniref:Uncharacterized protein n=1 Tax=Luteibacter flocculans TaxID=2780091 RepID=A0ABY4SZT6_9GAMM|nr:hypothetical protein [Luteibacter flocculans]URL58217.1 hypothetical protein IM816_16730 [Luteibacter flocculans]
MKSYVRLALTACLFSAAASANTGQAPIPNTFNAQKELMQFRVRTQGASAAFSRTHKELLASFLAHPSSPYSELFAEPGLANEIWWPEFIGSLASRFTDAEPMVIHALQRQWGFTKARPGIDIDVGPAQTAAYHGREAAANAMKAEVDADIFWRARERNGAHYGRAAGDAVALQILRDQIKRNDPSTYGVLDIEPAVLERYLTYDGWPEISEYDARYLFDLLNYALRTTPSYDRGGTAVMLPTIYRVSRTAAAYADANGYFTTGGHCSGNDARTDAYESIDEDDPLCFIAATDRAVKLWYKRRLHSEAIVHPPHATSHAGFGELMFFVLTLFDLPLAAEAEEAVAASELAGEGVLTEEEASFATSRASLTCGVSR